MTEHDTMASKGWSWIELLGGPEDGRLHYFKGTPSWALAFIDSVADLKKAKRRDNFEHRYEMSCGDDGKAIYRYAGEIARQEENADA